jgi:hypothetical protein
MLHNQPTNQPCVDPNICKSIRDLLAALPEEHELCFRHLLPFLRRVSDLSDKNQMGVSNLAIVFGPNILRPREETSASIQYTDNICGITEVYQLVNH